MSERPTIRQQIDEVEGCYLSIKSAVEAWQRAPEKHRSVETGAARSKLEPLLAAISTLKMVQDNQDWIREGLLARKRATA